MQTLDISTDGVLFDSDGVLVDSHVQVEQAWAALAAEFGLDFEELRTVLVGVPARQTLAPFFERDGRTPGDLDRACARLEDLEVETAVNTPPIPGARELMASLPAGRFAFATSATRRLADARWSAAGIAAPDAVVTANDVARGKPDPEPFLRAARLLGLRADRCVVFEDSDAGGRAAVAAGATVVAVGAATWSVEPAARVPDLRAVHVGAGSDGFALALAITPAA